MPLALAKAGVMFRTASREKRRRTVLKRALPEPLGRRKETGGVAMVLTHSMRGIK